MERPCSPFSTSPPGISSQPHPEGDPRVLPGIYDLPGTAARVCLKVVCNNQVDQYRGAQCTRVFTFECNNSNHKLTPLEPRPRFGEKVLEMSLSPKRDCGSKRVKASNARATTARGQHDRFTEDSCATYGIRLFLVPGATSSIQIWNGRSSQTTKIDE